MFSPVRALLKRFGVNDRESYIRLNWLGDRDPDGELSAAEESELPIEYQRKSLEKTLTDKEQ